MSKSDYEGAKKILEKNRDRLLKLQNVVGVGIGRKLVDGRYTDQISIRVYVTKKVAWECLRSEQRIPEEVEGVPTDVVEIGELRRLGEPTKEEHKVSDFEGTIE